MEIIDNNLLDHITKEACNNARLRMNYNFHKSLDDTIHRLLNAMEPETFFPVHRHANPDKGETCLILRGCVLAFIFDEDGNITSSTELCPKKGIYGIEIESGVWHTFVVLEPGTVLYEIKEGPYFPLTPENIAPWSPNAEDKESITNYTNNLLAYHRNNK